MVENKDKKVLNAPHLRFPEFGGEWEKIRLGDNCNILMCKRIMAAQTNTDCGVPFYKIGTIGGKADAYISKELFDEYKMKYSFPRKGEVMITCAGTVGKCIIYNGEDSYYQDSNIVWIDNPNKVITNGFLYHSLCKVNWSYLNSTTIVRIYNDDLRNLKLYIPQHDEQKKIAKLFSLLDERIATQNKVIEDLKKLKSAIAERVYNCRTYQLYRIGDVIEQVSKRNNSMSIDKVLSVSNKLGFINQSEQFEDRIVASEDTSNYKIVYKDDFAYNPARINVGSIARLKHFNKGIVSPMYICFRVKQGIVLDYLEYFFTTNYFFYEMQKRLEGSVRQCLSFEGLCNIPIYIPNLDEQQKIGRKVSVIMEKIDNENRYLDSLKMQKQYLLRQMFI